MFKTVLPWPPTAASTGLLVDMLLLGVAMTGRGDTCVVMLETRDRGGEEMSAIAVLSLWTD